ncbi:MAG: Hippuricase, partial [Ramlibacter sp.]|nr:Hippuricase [Ramlibacter sp.]
MPSDAGIPTVAWIISAGIAAVFVLVLLSPLLRGDVSFAEGAQAAGRQRLGSGIARSGIDVALVVLAGVAYWQLQAYRTPVQESATLAVDPVLVAAHIITAVQSIVSRNVSPVEGAVISLCAMQAGDVHAMSVIPGKATLVGTVRTFKPQVQDLVQRRLNELCSAIALGFGATAVVNYERIYPATINTPRETEFAANVAESLVGEDHVVRDMDPSMGAEDFSFMLQVKPGAYMRIGQGGEGSCMLHNSRYDFNDDILPLGAALHASLVEQSLPLTGA